MTKLYSLTVMTDMIRFEPFIEEFNNDSCLKIRLSGICNNGYKGQTIDGKETFVPGTKIAAIECEVVGEVEARVALPDLKDSDPVPPFEVKAS